MAERHNDAWGSVSTALAILSLLAVILIGHHHRQTPWWAILGFVLTGVFVLVAVLLFGWPFWSHALNRDRRNDLVQGSLDSSRRAHAPVAMPRESAAEARFDAPPGAELAVYFETEQVARFKHKAIIIDVRIRLENVTDKPKERQGIAWRIDWPEGTQPESFRDLDVSREMFRHEQEHPPLPHQIGPFEAVTGWASVALPHDPWGGVGGYTLELEDELGISYQLRREPRLGRRPQPSQALSSKGETVRVFRNLLDSGRTALQDFERSVAQYEEAGPSYTDEQRHQAGVFIEKSMENLSRWVQQCDQVVEQDLGETRKVILRSKAATSSIAAKPSVIRGNAEESTWREVTGRLNWLAEWIEANGHSE